MLGNPANRHRTVSLTAKQFQYAFGNAISEEESNALHEQWTIPGPGRPLFEDATAVTREVFGLYSKGGSDTEFHEFAGRGHSLTIDSGWRDVAEVTLSWLEKKGF